MTIARRRAQSTLRGLYWIAAALVLALPAVAMQFTGEVNWGPGDFLVMAGLLSLTGLALEGIFRAGMNPVKALLSIGLVLGIFLLIWAELAVGLFD